MYRNGGAACVRPGEGVAASVPAPTSRAAQIRGSERARAKTEADPTARPITRLSQLPIRPVTRRTDTATVNRGRMHDSALADRRPAAPRSSYLLPAAFGGAALVAFVLL